MRRMRTGTRERLTAACDTLIAVGAVLIIAAAHWPWAQAKLTSTDPYWTEMALSGEVTGLRAHGSMWLVTGIAVLHLALLLARYYPGGRLRVPGDGVLLALGSGLACLIVGWDMLAMPGPWANIFVISDSATFPWWGRPELLDGATLGLTWSYGAPVAAAAALTSLISAMVSPGPPAILLFRHGDSLQGTATTTPLPHPKSKTTSRSNTKIKNAGGNPETPG
jgi:hypothetical protein